MVPNKPYLRLQSINPARYSLDLGVNAGNIFEPPVVQGDSANSRLTITFKIPNGQNALPASIDLIEMTPILGSNVLWEAARYEKITVLIVDNTDPLNPRTVGSATALKSKALVNQPHAPKLWLKFNYTGSYDIYFDNGVRVSSLPPALPVKYDHTPPVGDYSNVQTLNSIIPVHDTALLAAEQGSMSGSDADASGDGKDLIWDL